RYLTSHSIPGPYQIIISSSSNQSATPHADGRFGVMCQRSDVRCLVPFIVLGIPNP
ncbi:hypothetical protein JMJ77_0014089, partial [Colletotrichum scovillei]